MKVKELFEMPYHQDGKYKEVETKTKSFMSDATLARNWTFLFDGILDDQAVTFYSIPEMNKIKGFVKDKKEKTGEMSNRSIFTLEFKAHPTIVKYPEDINKGDVLQVNGVTTSVDFQGAGIASFVYATLVKSGKIVISDTSQFDDGKALWKKMAKEAHLSDYVIHIIDDENGYFEDEHGEPISYDASNIDDAQIWTKGLDFSGEHILLMMK